VKKVAIIRVVLLAADWAIISGKFPDITRYRRESLKHEFWHERWEQGQIGFHQQEINGYLTSHWEELGLPDGVPVLVPLCGKSLDMLWLREQGHPVFGIELSRKAVEAFFHENEIEPSVNETDHFIEYSTEKLTLFAGDYFMLTTRDLGQIHAVFDRAALIALPPEMRTVYVRHMASLLPAGAHILLVTMQYPPGTLEGPPFSVDEDEVQSLYREHFSIDKKGVWDVEGPRGVAVSETVYLMTRNIE
jgi:thiopurine S-methyltransferase